MTSRAYVGLVLTRECAWLGEMGANDVGEAVRPAVLLPCLAAPSAVVVCGESQGPWRKPPGPPQVHWNSSDLVPVSTSATNHRSG